METNDPNLDAADYAISKTIEDNAATADVRVMFLGNTLDGLVAGSNDTLPGRTSASCSRPFAAASASGGRSEEPSAHHRDRAAQALSRPSVLRAFST
ncbi:MAG: hypothetical protein R2810_03675 [Flavobacteriales bacterium]